MQAIETRADYDSSKQEFVLTSPTPSSTKFMIGNVGVHGEIVVLMAQLYVAGERKGVHAFVVPLRATHDDASLGVKRGDLLAGVDVGDVGLKSSWNEVDNAWIRFKGMRIPRENLLNRFADVSADGQYHCSLPTQKKLFSATMAQLLVGRINYVGAPLLALQIALSTSIRYSLSRRQFSLGISQTETPIIQYTTQYSVLMHTLAKTIALQFAKNSMISRFYSDKKDPELLADYHATLSGLKAYVCEWAYVQLGHLRVMCGGAGIILANGIGALHNYFDVFQTAEGDRTVLYQQLGKHIVSTTAKRFAGTFGLLNFGLEVLGQQLIQLNPLLSLVEANQDEDLTSPGFLLKALEMRAKTTIRNVLSQMQNLTTAAKPLSPYDAWNACLPNIISASNAYLEHYVYKQCYDLIKEFEQRSPTDASPTATATAADSQKDSHKVTEEFSSTIEGSSASVPTTNRKLALDLVKDCLHTISAVAGLGFIKEDFGFYMRAGVFSSKRCDAIERAWMANCTKMRDNFIPLLLDSAEITPQFIDAPQGAKDGDYVTQILKVMKPSQAKL